MRAARWLVIATAVAAAAAALHLLLGPASERRREGVGPAARGAEHWPSSRDSVEGRRSAEDPSGASSGWRDDAVGGAPQDAIDAESRAAMEAFLRQSAEPVEDGN